MIKYAIILGATLAVGGQGVLAATSVATQSGGSVSYDATTATMTASGLQSGVWLNGRPNYGNWTPNLPGVATLTIGFAAPLVRTTQFQQVEWTGSGHRYVASFVRGIATSFEYVVNSLPDINGNTTNLLTVQSKTGFNIPFVSLSQLSYYYDFNGGITEGWATLYNPYDYYYDLSFLALFPPCNCSDSIIPKTPTTAFSATSDIPDYVQNIYFQSNAFTQRGGYTGFDLWQVRDSSVALAESFTTWTDIVWGPDVPEPASWVMMIAGFGLIGTALRRQRVHLIA